MSEYAPATEPPNAAIIVTSQSWKIQCIRPASDAEHAATTKINTRSVSYTHLTLPTIYSV